MKKQTKQKILRLVLTICVVALIVLAVYLPLELSGTLDKIDSVEELKEVILSGGAYSYIIFFILQFLQVTVLQIPSIVSVLAGTLIFGPWVSFAISFVAVMFGSIFAFFLGKKVGTKLINWIVGKEEGEKWATKLEKGKYVFFLMMLFPVFPDDILCLIAGTTAMTYKFFIITNLITRPISIACTCFLGSGMLIPFSGWGIPVWIALLAIVAIAFFVSIKYQSKIEEKITLIGEKLTKKNKKENIDK